MSVALRVRLTSQHSMRHCYSAFPLLLLLLNACVCEIIEINSENGCLDTLGSFETRNTHMKVGGTLQPELREEIIARLEKAMIWAGAECYDAGMQQFGRMLESFNRKYDPMRSRE